MNKFRKDKTLATIFILTALLINSVIIYQSYLNGEASSEVSGGVTKVLMEIINFFRPETINEANLESFVIFIRKGLGHFGAFMLSGIFTSLALYYSLKNLFWYQHYRGILMSLLIGLCLASLTEIIQLSVDNRSGQYSDVLLDSGGYVIGLMLSITIIYLVNKQSSAMNRSQ